MTHKTRLHLLHAVAGAGLLLGMHAVHAGTPLDGWQRGSQVTDLVTVTGPGEWTYEFTVINTSVRCPAGPGCEITEGLDPVIIDWELPYFPDMGIANITDPFGWAHNIETIGVANPMTGWDGNVSWWDPADPWYPFFGPDSPFGQNNLTQVLHWYVTDTSQCSFFAAATVEIVGGSPPPPCPGIVPVDSMILGHNNSLGGFSFTAAYDPAPAPYQASWLFLPAQSGDPAFPFGGLPGSPSVTGANGVPEPSVWLLIGAGGLLLSGLAARRR